LAVRIRSIFALIALTRLSNNSSFPICKK
jgi:hypothetical protein